MALEQVVRNTAVQYSRFGRSKRTPQWELIGLRNFGVKEKGHEKHTEIYLRLDILCMTAVIGSCLSVFPTRANAQGSPGQNAVYNSSSGIVGSYAFIDASTFAARGLAQAFVKDEAGALPFSRSVREDGALAAFREPHVRTQGPLRFL